MQYAAKQPSFKDTNNSNVEKFIDLRKTHYLMIYILLWPTFHSIRKGVMERKNDWKVSDQILPESLHETFRNYYDSRSEDRSKLLL